MVTRVDRKPIIYGTTYARVLRAPARTECKVLMKDIISKAAGYNVPRLSVGEILCDIDDIEYSINQLGMADSVAESWWGDIADDDDETLRIARMIACKRKDMKAWLREQSFMEATSNCLRRIFSRCTRVFFGTEAVYVFMCSAVMGNVFAGKDVTDYMDWAKRTTECILKVQSPYMLIHPSGIAKMAAQISEDHDYKSDKDWALYKKVETLVLRLGSRKNMLAHAYYSGFSRRAFEPSKEIDEDFEIPLTGFAECLPCVRMFSVAGMRYIANGDDLYCLSNDDCITAATMAQCYYRCLAYFSPSNGYHKSIRPMAATLVRDIFIHCNDCITTKRNFSHVIRSMHIMAQALFNDINEKDLGMDLGWEERSANYLAEATELDPAGIGFHRRALKLASNAIDQLNVCFIYHLFVGDEMLITDLRSKVSTMTGKVRDADKSEWARFIAFCKAYLLCRYMKTNKRKPKAGGDFSLLNDDWAEKCCRGIFTMPPQDKWGKVWIEGEFCWTNFADTWHLDAQDVAYVVKDSKGLSNGAYRDSIPMSCELLMAMTSGDLLDTLTGSTPATARARIKSSGAVSEVVLTTAPKAENAKPTWKKRVTFAADCEFRKMQAEYDRNCRKIMTFVRGPSLGVDITVLERQFADIAAATSLGLAGAVCSHDISAWSESMDRERKFEFESVLTTMLTEPDMNNIKYDWKKIKACVLKHGCQDIYAIDNGSFQGFDGSASTILHSLILIYCIDSARRKNIMNTSIRANMATLIDDCVALMVGLDSKRSATAFWAHLKATYLSLGFEVDDLKSIFSTIKAIYLSRRFLSGAEVPSDFKVFVKAHVSYEDPLRCPNDVASDIFGALRGSCDANGDAWFIYHSAVMSTLCELAHAVPSIKEIPPYAAAVFALAPASENGWALPSIVDWCTNDICDKRTHFNAIMEAACVHSVQTDSFQAGVVIVNRSTCRALWCIKAQLWRSVSVSSLFTNPFEALRDGPLKPDMLRRNAVSDLLAEVATAEPWKSLLAWGNSRVTNKVRDLLISSGPLHAPTLSALVNCMPDNYRLSMLSKAIGSKSVLDLLPRGSRVSLRRRVNRASVGYFKYSVALYASNLKSYAPQDFIAVNHIERTKSERDTFYTRNGAVMSDHTFPDPIGTFTHSNKPTGSMISPNASGLRVWDRSIKSVTRANQLIANKGLYVPKRSGRVWEITSEYAKGWDAVSQRIAMGLAVLSRAEADGHGVGGILSYFIKSWNEVSNITPEDTHLISIHGSIKRLDSNPGSASHPITCMRNALAGFNNKLKSAQDAISVQAMSITGTGAHLHDLLAHDTCMLAVTALQFALFQYLGIADHILSYAIATKPACVVPESDLRMTTNQVREFIELEIMESEDEYGFLQACPNLAVSVVIPTMKSSWVLMINALMEGNYAECESMIAEVNTIPLDDLLAELAEREVEYTTFVVLSEPPADRRSIVPDKFAKYAVTPAKPAKREDGDSYTCPVRTMPSAISRVLSQSQPDHVGAASVIKSIVWERMKNRNIMQLSKLIYDDEDSNIDTIRVAGSSDFWRGIIAQVSSHASKRPLSELTMTAFRALGVTGMHISHALTVKEVTQSVASYFGGHLREVLVLISSEVLSIAGRSEKNYAAPILERIITNNPAVANARLRRDHMRLNIKYNIDTLNDRIGRLIDGDPKHRGDKRMFKMGGYSVAAVRPRIVELRCRMYTYAAATLTESGSAEVDWEKLADTIITCGERVSIRLRIPVPTVELERKPIDPSDISSIMVQVSDHFSTTCLDIDGNDVSSAWVARASGWHAADGYVGIRYAWTTLEWDSKNVLQTQFAVTPSEVAPKMFRRIIHTEAAEPKVENIVADDDDPWGYGSEDLESYDSEKEYGMDPNPKSVLSIPLWKALYALLLCSVYTPAEVNERLGTSLGDKVDFCSLRDAHLEDFTDDQVWEAFNGISGDYMSAGCEWDERWLSMAEADAYLDDEILSYTAGYLF